jgi:hypothetical protein
MSYVTPPMEGERLEWFKAMARYLETLTGEPHLLVAVPEPRREDSDGTAAYLVAAPRANAYEKKNAIYDSSQTVKPPEE